MCAGVDIHDTLQGLDGRLGVQGAQHEVSGFSGGDRSTGGFEVTHFADENHIRVLTQRVAKPRPERRHIGMDLPLFDDASLGQQLIFHRVFQRDDVVGVLFVHALDHCRERRTFSATGRTGHEDQSARKIDEPLDRPG